MSGNMSSTITFSKACIAANRFGYGARANELNQAESDPKKWIIDQLKPLRFGVTAIHSSDVFAQHAEYAKEKKRIKKLKNTTTKVRNKLSGDAREIFNVLTTDVLKQAIISSNSVSWRLFDFFSNHFSVSTNNHLLRGLAATLEREAIAPNMFGKFKDLLMAVEQHPTMLIYLNNDNSSGPNSPLAKKRNKGLNENLAREILELHTLGVNGGYTQTDVIELAKGITGWSVLRKPKKQPAGFIFKSKAHEPGTRQLLGKHYPQAGKAQGESMLEDLANNPKTAKYLCFKIAHHFVSDNPPTSLLTKMEEAWKKSDGNIKQVMQSMFLADEAWSSSAQKYKSPREFVISTYRAVGTIPKNKSVLASLTTLGQAPFNAGSPAGYSDQQEDWLGSNALMSRIDWSVKLASSLKNINAEKIMNAITSLTPSEPTYKAVVRAESREQALTLLLMSPEFQRR